MQCTCGYGVETLPVDDRGFCKSFDADDDRGIESFFEEYGFVVVRNVVSQQLLQELVQDVCKQAQFEDGKLPADLEKVDWEREVYRSKYNLGKGFVGSRPCLGKAPTNARQSPKLVRVFQRLLHQEAIYSKFDRYGLMRPSKNHPEWKTDRGFVHWDQNPSVEPNFSRVQGVLAISEHTSTSGGFWAIPKFTGQHFARWAKENPRSESDGDLIDVTDECLRFRHAQKVTMQAGSICIWDSRTPHGNWPNEDSDEWRMCMYITYFCEPDQESVRQSWRNLCTQLPFVPYLTPLGRQIFALDPWPTNGRVSDIVDKRAAFTPSQCGYGF